MAKCKKCGGQMKWIKVDGQWKGQNLDGADHWDTCSANRWRQIVATGDRFENEKGLMSAGAKAKIDGYRNSKHGNKLSRAAIKPIVGRNYVDLKCDCGTPPWEDCKHTIEWRKNRGEHDKQIIGRADKRLR